MGDNNLIKSNTENGWQCTGTDPSISFFLDGFLIYLTIKKRVTRKSRQLMHINVSFTLEMSGYDFFDARPRSFSVRNKKRMPIPKTCPKNLCPTPTFPCPKLGKNELDLYSFTEISLREIKKAAEV